MYKCRLTTKLLHEANIPMGVEGQSVWCYAQGVEEVGRSDALKRQNTLCTDSTHLLLRQTAVPQRKDVRQGHILLLTHTYKYVQVSTPGVCTQCEFNAYTLKSVKYEGAGLISISALVLYSLCEGKCSFCSLLIN